MTFNQKKPTFPKNPFQKTKNIMEDTLNNSISKLKNYLNNYSYCDSIDPHYSIPIYDHTRSYSLCGFNPIKFYNENISSDNGLYQILLDLIDKRVSNCYQTVLVDVGIFWRYYKWIYNPNIRIPSSNAISVILGFWHTYKELCQIIFKNGIQFLFGPVLGQLFKNGSILLKPKLGILETIFNWLMLSYSKVKEKLEKYIRKSDNEAIRMILKNIRFIFTIAIPFVSFF